MFFKTVDIDEKLYQKYGFRKVKPDTGYGTSYQRYNEIYQYNHRVDICHKRDGRHIIQSYQEEVNKDGFNNCIGLTYKELKLFMKKYRQLKRKFRWH